LEPENLIPHFICGHAVEEIEQSANCFANGKLLGDNNSSVFFTKL